MSFFLAKYFCTVLQRIFGSWHNDNSQTGQ